MSDPDPFASYTETEDDELDTRTPWFIRIVAGVVILALLLFIVDLFVDLIVRWAN